MLAQGASQKAFRRFGDGQHGFHSRIYSTDKLRNWVSAYDLNHTEWSELAEEWWKFYAAREWLSGGFAWTGFDYRGEPTPYGWPSINSQLALSTCAAFPRITFITTKRVGGGGPCCICFRTGIGSSARANRSPYGSTRTSTRSNFFLNGKSYGPQRVLPLTHLEWKVKYEPGVLEARGSKDGKVVLVEKRETTGKPESIRLTADRTEISADGEDVAVLRVEVLDKEGRAIPTADNMISFKVTGEGALVGVAMATPTVRNLTRHRSVACSMVSRK